MSLGGRYTVWGIGAALELESHLMLQHPIPHRSEVRVYLLPNGGSVKTLLPFTSLPFGLLGPPVQ